METRIPQEEIREAPVNQAYSSNGKQSVIDHLHLGEVVKAFKDKTVPIHRTSIWYYAGGLTLLFFIIQVVTGILLLFYYEPSVEGAHRSVEMIMKQVPYGWLVRSIHSWSANALILMMFVHMFSAFLMKAYRAPRQVLWITGVLLLAVMLGFGFTGYLLPWDVTAYFATKIGTEVPKSLPFVGEATASLMRGAKEVNGATLTRLFALHVGVLPLLAILLVAAHNGLTLLFGSSVPVGTNIKKRQKFFGDYTYKEAIIWLVGFGVLFTVAFLYPWELGPAYDLANPSEPPPGVHPEWYFMFLFQTLKYVPEWVAVIGMNVLLLFWALVPWLDRKSRQNKKSPLFTIIGIIAILYITVMTSLAYFSVDQEKKEAAQEQHQTETNSSDQETQTNAH